MALIYILDDDRGSRELEAFALRDCGYEVEEFDTASEFIKRTGKVRPDLVIMEMDLKGMDGTTLIHRIRENKKMYTIPVLLISGKTSEMDVVRGLDAGADDYLKKPVGLLELLSRVQALLRRVGEQKEESEHWEALPDGQTIVVDDRSYQLSSKEYRIMTEFIRKRGRVISRDSLMETLWGIDFVGESRTLDMHIRSLRKKMGEDGKKIITVRGVGYRLED